MATSARKSTSSGERSSGAITFALAARVTGLRGIGTSAARTSRTRTRSCSGFAVTTVRKMYRILETMRAKALAPRALRIAELYVSSEKGSPFNQHHNTGKPGGEDVGPPPPETVTPKHQGEVNAKEPKEPIKEGDNHLHELANLTGATKNTQAPVQSAITKVEK